MFEADTIKRVNELIDELNRARRSTVMLMRLRRDSALAHAQHGDMVQTEKELLGMEQKKQEVLKIISLYDYVYSLFTTDGLVKRELTVSGDRDLYAELQRIPIVKFNVTNDTAVKAEGD